MLSLFSVCEIESNVSSIRLLLQKMKKTHVYVKKTQVFQTNIFLYNYQQKESICLNNI